MASTQTRRSISISGETYNRLKAHADSTNQSMSGVVEKLLKESLPKSADLSARKDRIKEVHQGGSHGFTF